MDPNEALRKARGYAEDFGSAHPLTDHPIEAAKGLVMMFQALDEWLSKGGFLPLEWSESLKKQRTCDVTACQSRATRAVIVCEKHFTERNPR